VGSSEHAVDIASRVGVEADQLTVVVDAVDGSRARSVRVVNGRETVPRCPGEPLRRGGATGAELVDPDDFVLVVDAECLRHRRVGDV
jgi:hypothetical protein